MAAYLIDGNTITRFSGPRSKAPEGTIVISGPGDLGTADLPMVRLTALWNKLPKVTRVSRFQNRQTAAERIWEALQTLPPLNSSDVKARRKRAPGKTSKQAKIIALLQRVQGATLREMVAASDWQEHSVRGLMSGALKKKLGYSISSTMGDKGRVYRIVGQGG